MRKQLLLFALAAYLLVLFQGCSKETSLKKIPARAKAFGVANIFSDNMVIQRDKPLLLWGHALNNTTIIVHVSWNSSSFSAVANASGNWQVSIPATQATTVPQTITCTINNTSTATLNNILIGDVWVCSGQSNMVMVMDSSILMGVINYKSEISAANYPGIRAITLIRDSSLNPENLLGRMANWQICSQSNAGNISAVAYYFARKLNVSLNVPIGVIISAVNGADCKTWASQKIITGNPLLKSYYYDSTVGEHYNAMIYPLRNLAVKGFIWYQGEANRTDTPPGNYTLLNNVLIGNWRDIFNQGTLPFYFVQVAPYNLRSDTSIDDYAKFREAQANIRAITNTGMAVTMDVGDPDNLHPRNKKPVGERLALLALKNTYNQSVACIGPQYLSYTINNNTATINYVQGTADGLNTLNNAPLAQYFFVAGTDHQFRQGMAVISGSQVIVTAPANTPLPIQAIRYAFTNYPMTNLQNSAGLPAEQFRTDDWAN